MPHAAVAAGVPTSAAPPSVASHSAVAPEGTPRAWSSERSAGCNCVRPVASTGGGRGTKTAASR
eukprot:3548107-Alexandrium_andersonii.AAC.1